VQREALGGQPGERSGVPGGRDVELQLPGVRPVDAERHPQQLGAGAGLAAVPSQQLRPAALAAVEAHGTAGGAHQLGHAGEQVAGEVGERVVGVRLRRDLQQCGDRPGGRRGRLGERAGGWPVLAVEPEPDALAGREVRGAPAAGEVVDQQQPAAAFRYVRDVYLVVARAGRQALRGGGLVVRHRHHQPRGARDDLDVELRAGVHDRVGG
jgi:hypothetical protein